MLFCLTSTAVENLRKEGIECDVYLVGDDIFDVTLNYGELARERYLEMLRLEMSARVILRDSGACSRKGSFIVCLALRFGMRWGGRKRWRCGRTCWLG